MMYYVKAMILHTHHISHSTKYNLANIFWVSHVFQFIPLDFKQVKKQQITSYEEI